jgi:hypothetical protein
VEVYHDQVVLVEEAFHFLRGFKKVALSLGIGHRCVFRFVFVLDFLVLR